MDKFCSIPFNTVSYTPTGYQSCCLHNFKIHDSTLDEYWNSDEMVAMRKGFLANKPVGQCAECVKFNSITEGYSGITHPGFFYGTTDDLATRTEFDSNFLPTENLTSNPKINPSFVVLNLSNKCNLACRTCSPYLSDSQINLHKRSGLDVTDKYCKADVERVISEINSFANLKEVVVVGGEPMLDPIYVTGLRLLRKDISVRVQCNGTVMSEPLIDEIIKFKECSIMFSIDGGESVNSYIRTGIKQDKFWSTVLSIVKYTMHRRIDVRFKLSGVLSSVSAFGIKELVEEAISNIGAKAFDDGIFFYSYLVLTNPESYRVNNLNKPERTKLLYKLKSDMAWLTNMIKKHKGEGTIYRQAYSVCLCVCEILSTNACDNNQRNDFYNRNLKYDKLFRTSFKDLIEVKNT